MSLLHFTDILKKAGLDPARVKLIRHSLSDKDFAKCYYASPQMVWEYTRIQKPNFSKDYDYWCVFISGKSTTARLFACYKVNGSVPATPDLKPADFPLEGRFEGNLAYFDLEPVDCLREFEHRLVIEWANLLCRGIRRAPRKRTSWPSTPPSKNRLLVMTKWYSRMQS